MFVLGCLVGAGTLTNLESSWRWLVPVRKIINGGTSFEDDSTHICI